MSFLTKFHGFPAFHGRENANTGASASSQLHLCVISKQQNVPA